MTRDAWLRCCARRARYRRHMENAARFDFLLPSNHRQELAALAH
jgi:hypothetical protein